MTLDEANALSAGIHAAAKELNRLIYEASAAGLDVDVETEEAHTVHGAPIKSVQTHVSLPLTGATVVNVTFVTDRGAAESKAQRSIRGMASGGWVRGGKI